MKWLVAGLCLMNAGVFLWATGHQAEGGGSGSGFPIVNAEHMRLLGEAQSGSSAGPTTVCARIGPFKSSAVMALAAQKLDAMSLSYTRRTVEAREIVRFRVFLGPFDRQAKVDAQLAALKTSGIDDYFGKHGRNGKWIVSLGVFAHRNGAETRLHRLGDRGIRAKLRGEEQVLGPNHWLKIDQRFQGSRLPRALRTATWGESQAQIRPYQC